MSNSECFNNIKQQISLNSETQLFKLDEDIMALKRLHASKGILQSSHTIRKVRDLYVSFFENKINFLINLLETLPIRYEKSLGQKLFDFVKICFEGEFKKIDAGLKAVIDECGGQQFESRYFGELHQKRDSLAKDLNNQIDNYIIRKKEECNFSNIDRLLILIEIVCIITIAFLAGKWTIDPNGNYEPYIVLLGIFAPLLEIGRRVWKKMKI